MRINWLDENISSACWKKKQHLHTFRIPVYRINYSPTFKYRKIPNKRDIDAY